jgi:hypothetical protein
VLSQHNPGNLCFPCQDKQFQQKFAGGEDLIDAEGYASILGLGNAKSVKRLAQKGKLPPRIPAIKKYLWRREGIETWIKQKGRAVNRDSRRIALGIASNLRTCRNNSMVCLNLSDEIGSKVYGQEHVFGTTDAGRTGPIRLVEVDRPVALSILEQLPEEDFPELLGIAHWGNLTYDSINEDLLVRIEAYF